MKHTPGPWKISNYRPYQIIARNPKESTYGVGDDKFPTLAEPCGENKQANAKLIAAAPDLLEACKEAKEYFDQTADVDDGIPNEEMNLLVGITQVINKAEGKE